MLNCGSSASTAPSPTSNSLRRRHRTTSGTTAYREGDVVAACDATSTEQKPVFALAKVLHVSTKKREVHLSPTPSEDDSRGQAFKFSVGQSSWREDLAALIHPIDVVYEPDNRLYHLRTTPSEIHAAFQAGRGRQDSRKRWRDGP